ncbi:unnamed protein product, partial [Prorocentrum cordatum]
MPIRIHVRVAFLCHTVRAFVQECAQDAADPGGLLVRGGRRRYPWPSTMGVPPASRLWISHPILEGDAWRLRGSRRVPCSDSAAAPGSTKRGRGAAGDAAAQRVAPPALPPRRLGATRGPRRSPHGGCDVA